MKTTLAFYQQLSDLGVSLQHHQGELRIRAAKGVLDDALKAQLKIHKHPLLALLAGEAADIPATEGQTRLWLWQQQHGGDAYHLALGLQLDGELDTARFCQALNDEIALHPALRIRLAETANGLTQRTGNRVEPITPQVAAEGTPQAWLDRLAAPEFDLSVDPPVRAQLIKQATNRHLLLLAFHHSAVDGWSIGLLLEGIALRYQGTPPADASFAVYRPPLATQEANSWWGSLLQNAPEPIVFPPEPAGSQQADHLALPIDGLLWSRLNGLAAESGISLHHWLNASVHLLLGKLYGKSDTVILTPYANRNAPDDGQRVGFLVNTLFSRAVTQPRQTLRELVAALSSQTLESQAFSHASYHQLQSGHPHLSSQVMFSLESEGALALPGVDVSLLRYQPRQAKFDLMLTVLPGAQPQCLFEYRRGALSTDIGIIAAAWLRLLHQAAQNPDALLQDLCLGSHPVSGSITLPAADPLTQIAQQVRRSPEAIAVARGSERWSYARLWSRVGFIARWLQQQGITSGSAVGICLPPGPQSLAATLAVLATGGAYVPLDGHQPAARLQGMIEDAGLALVLDEQSLPQGERDDEWTAATGLLSDAGWLIFTSGSTGRPKAAVVHRGGISRLLSWYQQAIGDRPMRALIISNTSFDLTQKNLFAPLMSGGQVLFPCMDLFEPQAVLDAMIQHRVTVINCTPTAFNSLLMEAKEQHYRALDSLRYVVLGGEPILLAPLLQWQAERATPCRFINSYGPTECADVVAWHVLAHPLTEQSEPIPLGQGISGALLSVVDHHHQPLPVGISGELLIDGDSVGLGYYRRSDLTDKQFLAGGGGINQTRYLTGDGVVLREDGLLYYLGRNDRQIKLNGYRIEIDEIEAALLASKLVDTCAVALRKDGQGNAILAAFYCTRHEGLTEEALWQGLTLRLAHYQVPRRYIALTQMPLTRSGKIDRNALPQTLPASQAASGVRHPQPGLEQRIAHIWQALLGCEIDDSQANFFACGGHSLLGMEVTRQVRRQLDLPATSGMLMQNPHLDDYARVLASLSPQQTAPGEALQEDPATAHPLTAMQQRLWFLWRLNGAGSDYSMCAAWKLSGALPVERLRLALAAVVDRHTILGSRLAVNAQKPYYYLDPLDGAIELEICHLAESDFPAFRQAFHDRPLDLAQHRFIRFALVNTAPQRHYLLVNLHHIAADGLSLPLLLEDLRLAWQDALPAQPAPQFFQLAQQRDRDFPELRQQWQRWLADAPQTSRFPMDFPDTDSDRRAGMQALSLSPAQWLQVKQQARQWGVTPFIVLLTSWFMLLQRYSHQQDLIIGVPIAMRDDPESAAVIGPLLNNVPVRVSCDDAQSVTDIVKAVSAAFDRAMSGAALPFEEIVDAVNPLRDLHVTPLFQIQVVSDPASLETLSLDGLDVTACPMLTQQAKYDLNVHFQTGEETFSGYIAYRSALFGENTLLQLAQSWQQTLASMVAAPMQVSQRISLVTPSSFAAHQQQIFHPDPTLDDTATLHGLFEAQVKRTPRATALIWQGGSLNYAELDAWANQLAHGLIAAGLAPGECVAVCLPRGAARIALLYGVLKAGGYYLPIDPLWPTERQQLVREQARPALYIDPAHIATLAQGQPSTAVESVVASSQRCYLMYTSGSTGMPKGVPILHAGVAHDLQFLVRRLGLGEGDRVLQLTSFSFDPAVRDQFATLASGACAVLPDETTVTHPGRILALMAEQRVSHILSLVPTLLRALLVEPIPSLSLRVLMLNGERLRGDDLSAVWRAFGDALTVINQYGPTEATMTSATHVASAHDEAALTVPLGRSNPNTLIMIMDDRGQLQPQGALGEICISGAGLSPGYLGQRSPEAFVWRTLPDGQRQRFYRSGDIGRWRSDGVLTFSGRKDFQVKLRGNRIELGEIDACIGQLPGVGHCAVNLIGDERYPILAAWMTEDSPGAVQPEAIKRALMAKLPAYMVPSRFTLLPELPVTASGKVDRRRLPQKLPPQAEKKAATKSPDELAIAGVWQQLLGLTELPDCETNFFEMGANSLMMVQASERIAGVLCQPLAVVDLFAHPTIRSLSQFMAQGQSVVTATPVINDNAARRRHALSRVRERRTPQQNSRNNQ